MFGILDLRPVCQARFPRFVWGPNKSSDSATWFQQTKGWHPMPPQHLKVFEGCPQIHHLISHLITTQYLMELLNLKQNAFILQPPFQAWTCTAVQRAIANTQAC